MFGCHFRSLLFSGFKQVWPKAGTLAGSKVLLRGQTRSYRPVPINARSLVAVGSRSAQFLKCAVRDRCSLRCKTRDSIALLHHFVDCIAFLRNCAGWASLDTFAAPGAIFRMAPIVPEVADNARVDSARRNLPNIRSFELSTHSDAAGAENAAIVIEHEARMRHIHGKARVVIGVARMRDAERLSQRLKFAMAVRDAYRANVITFHQQ